MERRKSEKLSPLDFCIQRVDEKVRDFIRAIPSGPEVANPLFEKIVDESRSHKAVWNEYLSHVRSGGYDSMFVIAVEEVNKRLG